MMAVAQVQGAACAAPPKPVTANEAKAKAVTSDFSIFLSPEYACLDRRQATRCAASLRASLLGNSRVGIKCGGISPERDWVDHEGSCPRALWQLALCTAEEKAGSVLAGALLIIDIEQSIRNGSRRSVRRLES